MRGGFGHEPMIPDTTTAAQYVLPSSSAPRVRCVHCQRALQGAFFHHPFWARELMCRVCNSALTTCLFCERRTLAPSKARLQRSGVKLCELCAALPPIPVEDLRDLCVAVTTVLTKATGVDFEPVLSLVRVTLAGAPKMNALVARQGHLRDPSGSAFGVCVCRMVEVSGKRVANVHIYLLRELPHWLAGSFLAHELIHAVVFLIRSPDYVGGTIDPPSHRLFEEGLCHLASTLWLSHHSRRISQELESPYRRPTAPQTAGQAIVAPDDDPGLLLQRAPASSSVDFRSLAQQLPTLAPALHTACRALRVLSLGRSSAGATTPRGVQLAKMVRELQIDFWLKKLLLGRNPQFSVGLVQARAAVQRRGWKDAILLAADARTPITAGPHSDGLAACPCSPRNRRSWRSAVGPAVLSLEQLFLDHCGRSCSFVPGAAVPGPVQLVLQFFLAVEAWGMEGDQSQLCQLLDAFLSGENAFRAEAEKKFDDLRKTAPDRLLIGLLVVLRQSPEQHQRQQAAVAVRTVLREFIMHRNDAVWTSLMPETKHALKVELLNSIGSEGAKPVRRAVCDTVADLAAELSASGEWPELNQQLIALIESPKPGCQAAGLKILAEMVPQLPELIRSNVAGVGRIALACAMSDDFDVRYECLCLVTALVHAEPPSVWKQVQFTLPHFLSGLQACLRNQMEEVATDFLVKFVEIADSSASFFKPHLADVVQVLFAIARNSDAPDEVRQMAVEVLLCIVEDKPRMCMHVPNFVTELVNVLFEMMLTIEDDPDWLDNVDTGADDSTVTRNYDVGESGLDRVASSLGGENIMGTVFSFAAQYLRRNEWQYKLVGIMAISQTVEYLPEEGLEQHLEEITNMLLAQLQDPHPRVRFAACQAIGQTALDHQPLFQKTYASVLLPALIGLLADPSPRVQAHAASALVNFGEEVEQADFLPFAGQAMERLFQRVGPETPALVREQCVTAIAVVAGVLEKEFLPYYPTVVPVMKAIISNATSKDERMIRGKAVECISIIGLSVGPETFQADAHAVMDVLLRVAAASAADEADDPLKEFVHEALCRVCRAMKQDFVPYLPHLVPGLLRMLSVHPEEVDGDEDVDDMTLVSMVDGRLTGLKTSVVEEVGRAIDVITIIVQVLRGSFASFLGPTVRGTAASVGISVF